MTATAYNPTAAATASPKPASQMQPSTPPGPRELTATPVALPADSAPLSCAAQARELLSQPVPGTLTQGEHAQALYLIQRFRNLALEALGQGVISRHMHDDITAEIAYAQRALVRINPPKE